MTQASIPYAVAGAASSAPPTFHFRPANASDSGRGVVGRLVVGDVRADVIQSEAFSQLHEALALPSNWDAYGAKPVSRAAAFRALGLLFGAAASTQQPRDAIELADVAPLPTGGLHVEWRRPDIAQSLLVEIDPQGKLSYLLTDGIRPNHHAVEEHGVTEKKILRVLRSLFSQ